MSKFQHYMPPPGAAAAEFSPIPLVLIFLAVVILYQLFRWCVHAVRYWWQEKVAAEAAALSKKDDDNERRTK